MALRKDNWRDKEVIALGKKREDETKTHDEEACAETTNKKRRQSKAAEAEAPSKRANIGSSQQKIKPENKDGDSQPKFLPRRFETILESVQSEKCNEKPQMKFFGQMLFFTAKARDTAISMDLVPKGKKMCQRCLCPYQKNGHQREDCASACCGRTRCRACYHRHKAGTDCACNCIKQWVELIREEMATEPDSE